MIKTILIMLVMALAIVLPLVYISRRHKDGKTVKKPLIAHCFGFFGLVAMATVFGFACSGTGICRRCGSECRKCLRHCRWPQICGCGAGRGPVRRRAAASPFPLRRQRHWAP